MAETDDKRKPWFESWSEIEGALKLMKRIQERNLWNHSKPPQHVADALNELVLDGISNKAFTNPEIAAGLARGGDLNALLDDIGFAHKK